MRDIADQLAFVAREVLKGNGFEQHNCPALRRALADAFEDLLNHLPEGTIHAEQ